MPLPFIHDDFLLESPQAVALYHGVAKTLPIIDYHCHLPPGDIARDHNFRNLTEIWLGGDHYKWRAMRTAGVNEHFITGGASDREKFEHWARTVPKTLRNPLYHWTHLELCRPFGIYDRLLGRDTAESIWQECNAQLAMPEYSTQGLLRRANVEYLCTTDDPVDDLHHHRELAECASFGTRVLPTFRCDNAIKVADKPAFLDYIERLRAVENHAIGSFRDYVFVLDRRHEFFHVQGCRLSDLGLETLPRVDPSSHVVDTLFERLLRGRELTPIETDTVSAAILQEIAMMNHRRGWVQQVHLGPIRNINTRQLCALGPNTGFDSIGDRELAKPLAQFLDSLDAKGVLAKTILFNINPSDSELMACLIGSFQDGSIPGKVQYGAAWWFLDQMDGITRQLEALSNMSLIGQFIGMLTDSRSFLSYSRHEYFRRILCNILGGEMRRGLLPNDLKLIGALVSDICYHNAKRYFPFSESTPSPP